jgi:hypothetical protein
MSPNHHRLLILWLGLCLASACTPRTEVNPKVPVGAKSSGGQHAVIETERGAIELKFFESEAPKAVENFRLLAEHHYYDGLTSTASCAAS